MALTSEDRQRVRIARSDKARKSAKRTARVERIIERELDEITKNGKVFGHRPEPAKRREENMFTCMWEGCDEPVTSDRGMACYCTRLQENGQTHRQMNAAKRATRPRRVKTFDPPKKDEKLVDDNGMTAKDVQEVEPTDWDKIVGAAMACRDIHDKVLQARIHLQGLEHELQVAQSDLRRLTE